MTAVARQPREQSENGAEVRLIDKLQSDMMQVVLNDFKGPAPADNKDSGSNTEMTPLI